MARQSMHVRHVCVCMCVCVCLCMCVCVCAISCEGEIWGFDIRRGNTALFRKALPVRSSGALLQNQAARVPIYSLYSTHIASSTSADAGHHVVLCSAPSGVYFASASTVADANQPPAATPSSHLTRLAFPEDKYAHSRHFFFRLFFCFCFCVFRSHVISISNCDLVSFVFCVCCCVVPPL